jgi:type I restriction enzyme S subunit
MIYDEERIMAVREGSGIPHVPKDFLSWYKVKVSCYSEQERIAKTFNIIDEEINELDQILKLNKKQKKGLMQKLLTGEVRVKI